MLYRMCAGRFDIPGLWVVTELGTRSIQATELRRLDQRVQRTYHGDTFRGSYSDELNTAFQSLIEHEDPEPCGAEDLPVHDQAVAKLSTFRNRPLDGMYLSPGQQN